MRKIIDDFYITVLFPLLAVTVISLWNSIRMFRVANFQLARVKKRLDEEVKTGSVLVENIEWRTEQQETKRVAKILIQLSSTGLVLFASFLFVSNNTIKLTVINIIWEILALLSFLSLLVATGMGWNFAQKRKWLKFGVCILALLLTLASTEHFAHQLRNIRHLCPECDDIHQDDDSP